MASFLTDADFWRLVVAYWLTAGLPIAVTCVIALLPAVRKRLGKWLVR
jgi:hypothetical protein